LELTEALGNFAVTRGHTALLLLTAAVAGSLLALVIYVLGGWLAAISAYAGVLVGVRILVAGLSAEPLFERRRPSRMPGLAPDVS